MNAAIELNAVIKRFGATVAVNQLNMTVSPGEVFAFLGLNGAGKTTTIKLIAGLLRPNAGTVRVAGQCVIGNGLAVKQLLAYVPDQPFLYDKLSGHEFLQFVGRMYGLSHEQYHQRLDELTERLKMGQFLGQLTESYSHGMKQKVVIASALLRQPQVLVIDEPLVGLDPQTARTVRDLFVELAHHNGTVFMSTHTLMVAETIADRIGIIHHGRLIAVGTMPELRRLAHHQQNLEEIFLHLTQDGDEEHEPAF